MLWSCKPVECASLDWATWFNAQRFIEAPGYIPPAKHETAYYQRLAASAAQPTLK